MKARQRLRWVFEILKKVVLWKTEGDRLMVVGMGQEGPGRSHGTRPVNPPTIVPGGVDVPGAEDYSELSKRTYQNSGWVS